MLCYITDGSAEFVVDRETATTRKEQVSYISEGCWLSYKALEDTFAFHSIRSTTSVSYERTNLLKEYYNFPLMMDVDEGIGPYFGNIYKWMRTNRKSKSFCVREAPDTLITSLTDILNSDKPDGVKTKINGLEHNLEQVRKWVKEPTVQTDPRIQTVTDYIMLNPTEEYISGKLSGMARVAETTFRRLFEEATGKTATELIYQIRLTTAARLSLVPGDPVGCIVHGVGFEDASHFTQVSRQTLGMTSGRYRKTSREQRWGKGGDEETRQGT